MRNKKAFQRLVDQGLTPQKAKYMVDSVRDLGYSPETITRQMTATKIVEIVESVDRALDAHFKKGG